MFAGPLLAALAEPADARLDAGEEPELDEEAAAAAAAAAAAVANATDPELLTNVTVVGMAGMPPLEVTVTGISCGDDVDCSSGLLRSNRAKSTPPVGSIAGEFSVSIYRRNL